MMSLFSRKQNKLSFRFHSFVICRSLISAYQQLALKTPVISTADNFLFFFFFFLESKAWYFIQGPVVQSVISLTTSLRVISLTVLADSIHNILIFFAEKMWVAFQNIYVSLNVNFNELLTNDIVSFEQLGPDCLPSSKPYFIWKKKKKMGM